MSMSTRLDGFGIYAAAVIAHENAQPTGPVMNLRFDAGGLRVAEGVDQCLTADQVNLFLNLRLQRFRLSSDKHSELHGAAGELVSQTGKGILQGHRRHRR